MKFHHMNIEKKQMQYRDNFVKAKVNIHVTPGEMLKTLRELGPVKE